MPERKAKRPFLRAVAFVLVLGLFVACVVAGHRRALSQPEQRFYQFAPALDSAAEVNGLTFILDEVTCAEDSSGSVRFTIKNETEEELYWGREITVLYQHEGEDYKVFNRAMHAAPYYTSAQSAVRHIAPGDTQTESYYFPPRVFAMSGSYKVSVEFVECAAFEVTKEGEVIIT